MKFSLTSTDPISGQASVKIAAEADCAFDFIAEQFFENYPKWATEVVDLEQLDAGGVHVGTKGRQVRQDNEALAESVFEVTTFHPFDTFALKGLDAPYAQTYLIEEKPDDSGIELTFRFDLLEIEIFMRPFEKLIRVAIEDGAETAVENIRNLLTSGTLQRVELQPGD